MASDLKSLEEYSWDGIEDAFQPVRDLIEKDKGIVPGRSLFVSQGFESSSYFVCESC